MRKNMFFNIYKSLSREIKEELDEIVENIKHREYLRADLSVKLDSLSPNEMETTKRMEREFISHTNSELEDIHRENYVGSNAEESEENKAMAIIDHEEHVREVLTTEYPMGILILDDEIKALEDKAFKLTPRTN